jgi:hypothetical protein
MQEPGRARHIDPGSAADRGNSQRVPRDLDRGGQALELPGALDLRKAASQLPARPQRRETARDDERENSRQ